jgi:hypothetical protein
MSEAVTYMPDTVSLREYIEAKCCQQRKIITAQMEAVAKALSLQAVETERRLEGLNELREAVERDRNMLVRRELYDSQVGDLGSKLQAMDKRITVIETRAVVWAGAITIMFVVVQLLIRFWSKP